MDEQPKRERERKPDTAGKGEVGAHPERGPAEMGTHQGGKARLPHSQDGLHGSVPSELPPRFKRR